MNFDDFQKDNFLHKIDDLLAFSGPEFASEIDDVYAYTERVFESQKPLGHQKSSIDARIERAKRVIKAPVLASTASKASVFPSGDGMFSRSSPKSVVFSNPMNAVMESFDTRPGSGGSEDNPIKGTQTLREMLSDPTFKQNLKQKGYGVEETKDIFGHPVVRVASKFSAFDFKYAAGTLMFGRADNDVTQAVVSAVGVKDGPEGPVARFVGAAQIAKDLVSKPTTDTFKNVTGMGYGLQQGERAYDAALPRVKINDITSSAYLAYRGGENVAIPKSASLDGYGMNDKQQQVINEAVNQARAGTGFQTDLVAGKRVSMLQDMGSMTRNTLPGYETADGQYETTGSKGPKHMFGTRGPRGDTGNYLMDMHGEVRPRERMLAAIGSEESYREGNALNVRYVSSRLMFGEGVGYAKSDNLMTLVPKQEIGAVDYYNDLKPGDTFTRDGRAPLFVPQGGRYRGDAWDTTRSNIPFKTGTQMTVFNVGQAPDPETGEMLGKPNMLAAVTSRFERSEFKQSSGKSVLVGMEGGHQWFEERRGFSPDVVMPMQDPGIRARALFHDLWLSQGASTKNRDRTINTMGMLADFHDAASLMGMSPTEASKLYSYDENGTLRFDTSQESFNVQMKASKDYFKKHATMETYRGVTVSENEFYGTFMNMGQKVAAKEDGWKDLNRAQQFERARQAGLEQMVKMGISNVRFQKYGEKQAVPVTEYKWKDNLDISEGAFIFDQNVLTFDAVVPANTTPVDTTGSAGLGPEFLGLVKTGAKWASGAMNDMWQKAASKNPKAKMLNWITGGNSGYESVDAGDVDLVGIRERALEAVDPQGRGIDPKNVVAMTKFYQAVLDQTNKAVGKKNLQIGGSVWSPARYAATAMKSMDPTKQGGEGYGMLMAQSIVAAAELKHMESMGMIDTMDYHDRIGKIQENANLAYGETFAIASNSDYVAGAVTNRVPGLTGMMAGFRGMPEDRAVTSVDSMRAMLIAQGFKGKELAKHLRQFESTGLQGLSVLYPSANTRSAMANVTYNTPAWASENVPGFDGIQVPEGGLVTSMTIAQSMAKDADGDRIAGFAFPGLRSTKQTRNNVERAWMNRGFEIHSAFDKDSYTPADYLNMTDVPGPKEMRSQRYMTEESVKSRDNKKLMGSDFNAFVRGWRDLSDIISDQVGEKLAFSIADLGQSIYQGSLDNSPMEGRAMEHMRGYMSTGAWFRGNPDDEKTEGKQRGVSPGYGGFTLINSEIAKKLWRNHSKAPQPKIYVNPGDEYIERGGGPEAVFAREGTRGSAFRDMIGYGALHMLGTAVAAPMSNENYGAEGLRFDDPNASSKASLLSAHARTMVPIKDAEDDVEVRRMAKFLWDEKQALTEKTDLVSLGRRYLEERGVIDEHASDFEVYRAAEREMFGDKELSHAESVGERAFLPMSIGVRASFQTKRAQTKRDYFGPEGKLIGDRLGSDVRMPGHFGADAEMGAAIDASIRLGNLSRGKYNDDPMNTLVSLTGKLGNKVGSSDAFENLVNMLAGNNEPDLFATGGKIDHSEVTIVGEMGPEVIYKGKVYPHSTYLKLFGGRSGRQIRDHYANSMGEKPRQMATGGNIFGPDQMADWMAGEGRFEDWMIQKVRQQKSLPPQFGVPMPDRTPKGNFVVPAGHDYQMNGGALNSLLTGNAVHNPILMAGVGIHSPTQPGTSYTALGAEVPGDVDTGMIESYILGGWIGGNSGIQGARPLGQAREDAMLQAQERPARAYSGPRAATPPSTPVPAVPSNGDPMAFDYEPPDMGPNPAFAGADGMPPSSGTVPTAASGGRSGGRFPNYPGRRNRGGGGGGSLPGGFVNGFPGGSDPNKIGYAIATMSELRERLSKQNVTGALRGFAGLKRQEALLNQQGGPLSDILGNDQLKAMGKTIGQIDDVSNAMRQLRAMGVDTSEFIEQVSAGDYKYANALEMIATGSSMEGTTKFAGTDISAISEWGQTDGRHRSPQERFAGKIRAEQGQRNRIAEQNNLAGFREVGIRAGVRAFMDDGFDKKNFDALVDLAGQAQPGESSKTYGALKRIYSGVKEAEDLPMLAKETGLSIDQLQRGQATLTYQDMRGVKANNESLSAEADVSAVHLNSLAKSVGAIDDVFGKLGQTTKMLVDEKQAYGKQIQHLTKTFEGMIKAGEQIAQKEKLGIPLSANERMSKGLMESGPLADRLNQYKNTRSLFESDASTLQNDRIFQSGRSESAIQADIMDKMMMRGTRGSRMREGYEFQDDIRKVGLDLGPLGSVKDVGMVKALAGGMRMAAGVSGAMFGMTMAKYNLIEPANQMVQGYLENQQKVGDALVGFGGINRAQLEGNDLSLGHRRMASGAQFQLGMGESIMNNFDGLFRMGGGKAAGNLAGDVASVAAPALLGSMMMSSLSMPALAAPAAILAGGFGAISTFASKVNNPEDITNLVASSRNKKSGLFEELGFVLEAAAAAPAVLFGDPEKNDKAYDAGVWQNRFADAFSGSRKIGDIREAVTYDTRYSKVDIAKMEFKGFEALLSDRFTPDEISQFYGAYQTYGLAGDANAFSNQYSTAMARGVDPMMMHQQVSSQFGMNPLADGNTFIDLMGIMNSEAMGSPTARGAFTQAAGILSGYYSGSNKIAASYLGNESRRIQGTPADVFMQSLSVATGVTLPGAEAPKFMSLPEDIRPMAAEMDLAAQEEEAYYRTQGVTTSGPTEYRNAQGWLIETGNFMAANRRQGQAGRRQGIFNNAMYGNYGNTTPGQAYDIAATITNAPTQVGNLLQGALSGDAVALTAISQTAEGRAAGFNYNLVDLQTGQSPFARHVSDAEYDTIAANAELGGADMSRMFSRDQVRGGMIKLQRDHSDKMFGYQMAGYGIQAASAQMGFAFMTGGTRQLDAQGFAVGGDIGAAVNRAGFNPGNGMGQWQVQDAMTAIQREKQDWNMDNQKFELEMADKNKALQIRQFNEQWDMGWDWMKTTTKRNRQEMNIARGQSLTTREWQSEDMAVNQQTADIQFGWQQEDFSRNIRYARGRERLDMQREQNRGVTMFNIQQNQREKEKDRFDEQNKWADERFEREKDFFKLSVEHTKDEMKMQKRHFMERMALEDERMDRAKKNFEKEMAWLAEQRKLEDQSRLLERQQAMFMHDFNMASIGVAMAAAQEAKKFQDAVDQWKIGEEVTTGIKDLNISFGLMPDLIDAIKEKVDLLKVAIAALPNPGTGGGTYGYNNDGTADNDGNKENSLSVDPTADTGILTEIRDLLRIVASNPNFSATLNVFDKDTTIAELERLLNGMV